VGAFYVHGPAGMWGTLAVRLFQTDKGLSPAIGLLAIGYRSFGVILAYGIFSPLSTSWVFWSVGFRRSPEVFG